MTVRIEPVRIDGVEDGEGGLAYREDRLVAVLVRLGEHHGAQAGSWFVEQGFGPLDRRVHPTFPSLEAARAWLTSELADLASGGRRK